MSRIADRPLASAVTFRDIVSAIAHTHREVTATKDEDVLEEIKEHLDWIYINIEEGDTIAAKIENLANAVAAAERYGGVLMAKITEQQARAIQTEILS